MTNVNQEPRAGKEEILLSQSATCQNPTAQGAEQTATTDLVATNTGSVIQPGTASDMVIALGEILGIMGTNGTPDLPRYAIDDKGWKLPDSRIVPRVDAVILGSLAVNRYFDSPYGKGEKKGPACYSNDRIRGDRYGECQKCKFFEWVDGKGRDCTERIYAYCLSPEDDLLFYFDLSPISIKPYYSHLKNMRSRLILPYAAVTTVSVDSSGSPKATFAQGRKLTPEEFQIARAYSHELRKVLDQIRRGGALQAEAEIG